MPDSFAPSSALPLSFFVRLATLAPPSLGCASLRLRFIQSPLSDMKLSFAKRVTGADEEIKALEKTQKYWERSAADAQGNLRDILGGPRNM